MINNKKCYIVGIDKNRTVEENLLDAERIIQGTKEIVDSGERNFVCVMNKAGVYIADYLLSLKESVPDIKVDALIPYEEIAADWDEPLRDKYFQTIEKCENDGFFTLRYYDGCFEDMISSIVDGAHRVVTVIL